MPRTLTLLLAGGCLWAAGCRSHCDLVEAELRTRERELRELREELHHAEACQGALEREVQVLRPASPNAVSPEFAAQAYGVKELVLGRLTGGVSEHDCEGDDALQVVVEPRDCDGHNIKAPGRLAVEALEITPEGLKAPLCAWDVPPDQLRREWKSGIMVTGYVLVLPWKNWPNQPKVRVVARLTLPDGRLFEADRDVVVRVTPPDKRKALPTTPPEELPSPALPADAVSFKRTAHWPSQGLAGTVQVLPPQTGAPDWRRQPPR